MSVLIERFYCIMSSVQGSKIGWLYIQYYTVVLEISQKNQWKCYKLNTDHSVFEDEDSA